MANIFRTINTKFLSKSVWFCRRRDKKFGVVFGFTVPIAVHLQNVTLSFTR